MKDLYYTPPTDEVFNDVKACAIRIWLGYDNTYGYVDEKVGRIKDLANIEDNVMYIVSMFDMDNQGLLASLISEKSRRAINDRMIAGGNPIQFNPFYVPRQD